MSLSVRYDVIIKLSYEGEFLITASLVRKDYINQNTPFTSPASSTQFLGFTLLSIRPSSL